jgi:AcrR family transcriptional regulator
VIEGAGVGRTVDGRHLRAQRTRAAISRALFELIEEGTAAPTAQQIADRAGVALRSIRQHFETRESLFLAAAEHYAPHLSRPRETPDPDAALEVRLARLVAARATELESTRALRRAVQRLEAESPSVAARGARLAAARRQELEQLFAPELNARTAGARRQLLDRLDAVAGGRLWDALRLDLALPLPEATRQLGLLLRACLEG